MSGMHRSTQPECAGGVGDLVDEDGRYTQVALEVIARNGRKRQLEHAQIQMRLEHYEQVLEEARAYAGDVR